MIYGKCIYHLYYKDDIPYCKIMKENVNDSQKVFTSISIRSTVVIRYLRHNFKFPAKIEMTFSLSDDDLNNLNSF